MLGNAQAKRLGQSPPDPSLDIRRSTRRKGGKTGGRWLVGDRGREFGSTLTVSYRSDGQQVRALESLP